MKRIATIALTAVIAASGVAVGQTNVSFWVDLGPAGFNVSTGSPFIPVAPPPPPRRVRYVEYDTYDYPPPGAYGYGRHNHKAYKKYRKAYKKYRKAQKKYYKERDRYYRHGRHHHHDD